MKIVYLFPVWTWNFFAASRRPAHGRFISNFARRKILPNKRKEERPSKASGRVEQALNLSGRPAMRTKEIRPFGGTEFKDAPTFSSALPVRRCIMASKRAECMSRIQRWSDPTPERSSANLRDFFRGEIDQQTFGEHYAALAAIGNIARKRRRSLTSARFTATLPLAVGLSSASRVFFVSKNAGKSLRSTAT